MVEKKSYILVDMDQLLHTLRVFQATMAFFTGSVFQTAELHNGMHYTAALGIDVGQESE